MRTSVKSTIRPTQQLTTLILDFKSLQHRVHYVVLIGARASAHTGKVLELGGWFYLLFKRYVCLTCKTEGKRPYTFQGCDPRLMELFPEALAAELPIVVPKRPQNSKRGETFPVKSERRTEIKVIGMILCCLNYGFFAVSVPKHNCSVLLPPTASGGHFFATLRDSTSIKFLPLRRAKSGGF